MSPIACMHALTHIQASNCSNMNTNFTLGEHPLTYFKGERDREKPTLTRDTCVAHSGERQPAGNQAAPGRREKIIHTKVFMLSKPYCPPIPKLSIIYPWKLCLHDQANTAQTAPMNIKCQCLFALYSRSPPVAMF